MEFISYGKTSIYNLKLLLENLNHQKDQFLFSFIKTRWPKRVTPNHLTIVRMVIGAFLFVLLFNFKIDHGFIIIPFFFVGILTDLLDGAIARGLNMETKFGTMADPVADRVLIIPVAIYSLLGNISLLTMIIFLEIFNACLSLFAHDKKIFSGSNIFGKTKMVLQSLVLIGILILWPLPPNILFIGVLWISVVLMIISLVLKIIDLKLYYSESRNG